MAKKLKWRFPPEIPPVGGTPDQNAGGRYSERVLLLTNRNPDRYTSNAEFSMGRYSHAGREWMIESGYGPNLNVIAWAYLRKP